MLLHILIGAARGGCERNALQVIRHLPAVPHRVLVLDRDGPMTPAFREAGAAVDVLPRADIPTNARLIAGVRARVERHPPAAVMVWHGLVWLPQILYALRDFPGAVAVHGGNPAHTMPGWVNRKFDLLGLRYPIPRRPTYICPTRYTADSFDTSRYLRRFPRVVVPNPVEVPTRPPHEPRPLTADRPLTVGMLARLDPIKDHATVVRALAAVRETYPLARLEFAGGGPQEPALRSLAAGLGLADAVSFLGSVADGYGAMAGWDLFAYATTDREGLGNALVEAMMLGLPCVATDVGPVREVCGTPPAAALVPPADPAAVARALARLAGDVDGRRNLGALARASAHDRFRPEVAVRGYAAVLFPGGGE